MIKETPFTKGPILGPLLNFTVPIFLSLLLQVLYGAVDLIVVGQFSTEANISAVATGSQLVHVLLTIISGLCMGTTILLGQKTGAGKSHEAGDVVGSTICIFTICALILTLLMTVFASVFSRTINAPAEAFSETTEYIRISGFGIVFLIAYNVFGGIFRGIGDSKTPFIAVAIAAVLNILGDLLLVAVFGMGAKGAALSTVAAQAVSVFISIAVVRSRGLPFPFSCRNIKLNPFFTPLVLKLGAPVAIQNGLIQFAFLVITAIVNKLGVTASSGMGITEKLSSFLMLIQIAFGESLAAFAAHNVGAEKYERARHGLYYTCTVSCGIGILLTWFSFFHGDLLLRIFTHELPVIAAGTEYLKAYSFDITATALLFCFVGYFNGFGKTRFVMLEGIIGALAVRIPLAYILSTLQPVSLFNIGLAIPFSSASQDILCFVYFLVLQKKLRS